MKSRGRLERVKALAGTFVALVVSLAAMRGAGAQTAGPALGDSGHVALSAERLFGFVHTSSTTSSNGMDRPAVTMNGISLLGNPIGGLLGGSYAAPRLGFDAFVAGGLSLGVAAAYFHTSESQPAQAGSTAGDSELSLSGVILAPRIGFAAHLGPTVSLWPRAGVTYLRSWSDNSQGGKAGSSSSSNLFAATLEVPLAVTLTERAAFLIGPTLDIGLSGGRTSEPPPGSTASSTSTDIKETDVGVQAALLILL
jgi:hypothetical protein